MRRNGWNGFDRRIARREERMLRARGRRRRSPLYGFGLFGMVGWSVAVPTLLCTALGVWIDRRTHSQYSWTLMLLLFGVIIGSLNAWYWVKKESRNNHDHNE